MATYIRVRFPSFTLYFCRFLCFLCTLPLLFTHDTDNTKLPKDWPLYNKDNLPTNVRFLLYDVNPGEGFNLRRDVYMRVANLAVALNAESPWILVLPAWTRLYHWQTKGLAQTRLPWATFFDLESLNNHVPVMEFKDFLKVTNTIDSVYYLQRYSEGWTDGKFEQKIDQRPCIETEQYRQHGDGRWEGYFFGFHDVSARAFTCVSVQGHASVMKRFLFQNNTTRSVFIDRAENLLHDHYGSKLYWEARRSMVYAKHLRDISDDFRRDNLDSTDEQDGTILLPWWKMQREHGEAKGGPYICAHVRRQDYTRSHKKDVPSLKHGAAQLRSILQKYNLTTLFVASDMPKEEFVKFRNHMRDYKVFRYTPTEDILEKYKDGGVSVIDQWTCAHARYFTGTHVSTFSFRIQEDREILGFKPETTFNNLCGGNTTKCEQPTRWMISYSDNMYW